MICYCEAKKEIAFLFQILKYLSGSNNFPIFTEQLFNL